MDTRIKELLVSGGDERIHIITDIGKNKYYLNPLDFKGLFHRGSCTAGILNPDNIQAIEKIDIENFDTNFEQVIHSHTSRIKRLFDQNEKVNFEVFFAPSGSDLVYFPLLFSKLLFPEENLRNILTCPEELGSGSLLAAQGKYYSEYNQFGKRNKKYSLLSPEVNPEMHLLPARGKNGKIANNIHSLRKAIQRNKGNAQIINLVYGSKSGIEENLSIKDEFDLEKAIWTVDLCQLRIRKKLIIELLDKGYILMLTGSKFYQAPPFCGCLLVPNNICDQLRNTDGRFSNNFRHVFSSFDIPSSLSNIRKHLPSFKNLGLHLRWEAGLSEMEAFDSIDSARSDAVIASWNTTLVDAINASSCFYLMPDTEKTNKTIISFRLKKKGRFLNFQELKIVFEQLVSREDIRLDGYNRAFIGQPVKYGKRAFLRIAIGSYDIRQMLAEDEDSFENDIQLLQILEKQIMQC